MINVIGETGQVILVCNHSSAGLTTFPSRKLPDSLYEVTDYKRHGDMPDIQDAQ